MSMILMETIVLAFVSLARVSFHLHWPFQGQVILDLYQHLVMLRMILLSCHLDLFFLPSWPSLDEGLVLYGACT